MASFMLVLRYCDFTTYVINKHSLNETHVIKTFILSVNMEALMSLFLEMLQFIGFSVRYFLHHNTIKMLKLMASVFMHACTAAHGRVWIGSEKPDVAILLIAG